MSFFRFLFRYLFKGQEMPQNSRREGKVKMGAESVRRSQQELSCLPSPPSALQNPFKSPRASFRLAARTPLLPPSGPGDGGAGTAAGPGAQGCGVLGSQASGPSGVQPPNSSGSWSWPESSW